MALIPAATPTTAAEIITTQHIPRPRKFAPQARGRDGFLVFDVERRFVFLATIILELTTGPR